MSLREYGWTTAVLVDEGGRIIAGHGRVEAAKREGFTEVPVIVATGWTEAQRRAYALADNRIPLNSDWDRALLGLELGELSGLGVDLGTLGFEDAEIVGVENFDDVAPDDEVGETEEKAGRDASSRVRVGPYSIDVAGPMLKGWITKIREECQDDEQKIKLTILQRLGIAA